MNNNIISTLIKKELGYNGRTITMSKGRYTYLYPDNIVYFNANIVVRGYGKVWYGDIDLTNDIDKLKNIAKKLYITLYILSESSCNFNKENNFNFDDAVFYTDGSNLNFCKNQDSVIYKKKCGNKQKCWYHNRIKPIKHKKIKLPKYYDIEFKETDFFLKIKIDMKKLKKNPLQNLYNIILQSIEEQGFKKSDMEDWSLYYSKETHDKIIKAVRKWLIKEYNYKKKSYDLRKELMWIIFDLPICFESSKKGALWVGKDTIYIKR